MTVAEAEIYVKDKKYLKAIDVYKSAMKVYDDGSLSGKIEDVEKHIGIIWRVKLHHMRKKRTGLMQ